MANKTRSTIRRLVREKLNEISPVLGLQANVSTTTTQTISINDGDEDYVQAGDIIQIGDELMKVRVVGASNGTKADLTCQRGLRGTTAATHTAGASITVFEDGITDNILDQYIDNAVHNLWPEFYIERVDTRIELDDAGNTFEYTLPDDCEHIIDVRSRADSSSRWRRLKKWYRKANKLYFWGDFSKFDNQDLQLHYVARPTPFGIQKAEGKDGYIEYVSPGYSTLESKEVPISNLISSTTELIAIKNGDWRGLWTVVKTDDPYKVVLYSEANSATGGSADNDGIEFAVVSDSGVSETNATVTANGLITKASGFTGSASGDYILGTGGETGNIKVWRIESVVNASLAVTVELESTMTAESGFDYTLYTVDTVTSDNVEVPNELWIQPIVYWAVAEVVEQRLAKRAKYTDYAASINDRASSADELMRTSFYWKNQFRNYKDEYGKPFPMRRLPKPER